MNDHTLEMTRSATLLDAAVLAPLKGSLRGQLIQPGDNNYHESRQLYNGMIDKRPGLIVRCVDAADVQAAINFARENGLLAGGSRRRAQWRRPGKL